MKTWFIDHRPAMIKAFFAAVVIPLTLAFVALEIYFANVFDLAGTPREVLVAVFSLAAIGVFLLFVFQIPFLGRNAFPWIATTLFTLGFLLWFQAHVLNWNLGRMDGSLINWKAYQPLGIVELFLYIAFFVTAFRFKAKLLESLVLISCVLIFMQAVPVSFSAAKILGSNISLHAGEQKHSVFIPSWKKYSFTYDGLFDFSREENVVLIVLDALGIKIFDDIQREHPEEIGEVFRDFTFFTNAMCNKPGTFYNISQILTGCQIEEIEERCPLQCYPKLGPISQYEVFNQNGALLKTLAEHQYQCDVYLDRPGLIYYDPRWIANIRPNRTDSREKIPGGNALVRAGIPELTVLTLFRTIPLLLKPYTIKSDGLRERLHFMLVKRSHSQPMSKGLTDDVFDTLLRTASHSSFVDQKTLKFFYLQGAHSPYLRDENGVITELFGIESEKRQALGALRLVGSVLELMKESGVYDQSLIIIMSDHGPGGDSIERLLDHSTSKRPSFLMKRKHIRQSQMAYNDNPVHIHDTASTILSELGILPEKDVFSPFDMPDSLVKERKDQWKKFLDKDLAKEELARLLLIHWKKRQYLKMEWLELIRLRPSQPLPNGHHIPKEEIAREDLSIQENNVLQVDIRGDRVSSVMFDKNWTTTVMLTSSEQSGDTVFVSEKPMAVIPFNTGQPVESWVCFQKLKAGTLPDGQYQIDVFFQKGSSASQWKTSKVLSVTTNEQGEKVLELLKE